MALTGCHSRRRAERTKVDRGYRAQEDRDWEDQGGAEGSKVLYLGARLGPVANFSDLAAASCSGSVLME